MKGKIYKNYPEAVSIHGGDATCPMCGVPTGSFLPYTWHDAEGSKYAFFCGNHSIDDLRLIDYETMLKTEENKCP